MNTHLRQDLKLNPYIVPALQDLPPEDITSILETAGWFDERIGQNESWISPFWFNDEFHFTIHSGFNIKFNTRWDIEKKSRCTVPG